MENINAFQTPDTSELACGCVIINPHHAFYAEWVSLGVKTECDCAKREAIRVECERPVPEGC